jgi:hypothetical protein
VYLICREAEAITTFIEWMIIDSGPAKFCFAKFGEGPRGCYWETGDVLEVFEG